MLFSGNTTEAECQELCFLSATCVVALYDSMAANCSLMDRLPSAAETTDEPGLTYHEKLCFSKDNFEFL